MLEASAFDAVISLLPNSITSDLLTQILRVLKPGAVTELQSVNGEELSKSLLFAGFTDIKATPIAGGAAGAVVMTAARPPWAAGASAAIVRKKKPAATNDSSASGAAATTASTAPTATDSKSTTNGNGKAKWSFAASDMTDASVQLTDLVDDNSLLEKETERVVVPTKQSGSDCGTGPGVQRKACKNCSCGLAAELIAEEKAAKAKAGTTGTTGAAGGASAAPAKVVSACGNVCSLGIAIL